MTIQSLQKLQNSGIVNLSGLAKYAGINTQMFLARIRRGTPELTIPESMAVEDSLKQVFEQIGGKIVFDRNYDLPDGFIEALRKKLETE